MLNDKLTGVQPVARENKDHILKHYNPDKRYKPVTYANDKEALYGEGPTNDI